MNNMIPMKTITHGSNTYEVVDEKARIDIEKLKILTGTEAIKTVSDYATKKANAIVSSTSGETAVTTDSANTTPSITLFGKGTQHIPVSNNLFNEVWRSGNPYEIRDTAKQYINTLPIYLPHVDLDGDGKEDNYYLTITINGEFPDSYIWQLWRQYGDADITEEKYFEEELRLDESNSVIVTSWYGETMYVRLGVFDKSGADIDLDVLNSLEIMINEGQTALPYEPYGKGVGLDNPINVVGVGQRLATGKQLLDYENSFEALSGFEVTKTLDGGLHIVGTNKTNGVQRVVRLFPPKDATYLEKGKTYTYTCRGAKQNLLTFISSATNIHGGVQFATFVWEQTGTFGIDLGIDKNSSIDTIVYPMLVEGTYTPSWEPYDAKEGSAVDVNTRQVIYSGNICPKTVGSITHNGVTFDFTGDHVVAKGTKPADVRESNSANLNIMLPIIKGTYYLPKTKNANVSVNMAVVKADGTKTYPKGSWTFDGTELFARFYISVAKENTEVTVDEVIPLCVSLDTEEYKYDEYKEPQVLVHQTPNGLGGIPLGQTIPSEIANSPTFMSGVYHDGEQYWVSDTIDNRQRVQRILRMKPKKALAFKTDNGGGRYSLWLPTFFDIPYGFEFPYQGGKLPAYCNVSKWSAWANGADGTFCLNGDGFMYKDSTKTMDEINAMFAEVGTDIELVGIIREPIVTDLTEEELAQYNVIHMNYPNNTIVNSDNAYQKVEYVADTKCYIDKKFNEIKTALVALGG